jgi:hypothetical protein
MKIQNPSVTIPTATYLDMTFATTANITSVVEIGVYSVHTKTCITISDSFPMSLVNDMKGEPMTLIEISICLLIIYAIIIRRQVDRIEEKIDVMLAKRRIDDE